MTPDKIASIYDAALVREHVETVRARYDGIDLPPAYEVALVEQEKQAGAFAPLAAGISSFGKNVAKKGLGVMGGRNLGANATFGQKVDHYAGKAMFHAGQFIKKNPGTSAALGGGAAFAGAAGIGAMTRQQ